MILRDYFPTPRDMFGGVTSLGIHDDSAYRDLTLHKCLWLEFCAFNRFRRVYFIFFD